jgi:hypothetical protein
LVFSLLLFSSLLAGEPFISSTASPQVASASSSPKPSDLLARLSALSDQLWSEADELSIEAKESRSLLLESKTALENSQKSLDLALAEAKKKNLELWIWRGSTAALVIVDIVAVVLMASRK